MSGTSNHSSSSNIFDCVDIDEIVETVSHFVSGDEASMGEMFDETLMIDGCESGHITEEWTWMNSGDSYVNSIDEMLCTDPIDCVNDPLMSLSSVMKDFLPSIDGTYNVIGGDEIQSDLAFELTHMIFIFNYFMIMRFINFNVIKSIIIL